MKETLITNPLIIMLINMTIVFSVLYGLSLLIRLLHLVDPTRRKQIVPKELPPELSVGKETVAAEKNGLTQEETFVLIAAALAAYGYHPQDIISIHPADHKKWTQAARIEGVHWH